MGFLSARRQIEKLKAPGRIAFDQGHPEGQVCSDFRDGSAATASGALREKLGLKHRPTFRVNSLHPALKKGYVKYTISKNPSSRLQKFELTGKGRTLVLGKP